MIKNAILGFIVAASATLGGTASAAPIHVLEPESGATTGSGIFDYDLGGLTAGLFGAAPSIDGAPDGGLFLDAFLSSVILAFDQFDPLQDVVFDILSGSTTSDSLIFELVVANDPISGTPLDPTGEFAFGAQMVIFGFDPAPQTGDTSPYDMLDRELAGSAQDFVNVSASYSIRSYVPPAPVPLPAGGVLLVTSLVGFGLLRRRRTVEI